MGLLALGIDNPNTDDDIQLVPFDEFCSTSAMDQFLSSQDHCNVCSETSVYIVLAILITIAAYIPTFTSNILRLYNQYDMNCTKTASGCWSLLSILGYITVYYCYNYICLPSLYYNELVLYAYDTSTSDGTIISSSYTIDYDEDGVINKSDYDTVIVDFLWNIGPGQILFLVGFGLKIIDFICNCCIATPIITRSREEQWEYENLSLMQSENNNKMDMDKGSSPALSVAGAKIEGDNYVDHGDDDDNSTQEVV